MKKTVAFGEILLRLSPPANERFMQSPMLGATFGGGEANVAMSLAELGLESHFVTRLPGHAIGDAALRTLKAEGVHTHVLQTRLHQRRLLLQTTAEEHLLLQLL